MKWFLSFALFFFLNKLVFASAQPEKESHLDLRGGLVMFVLEDLDTGLSFTLERASDWSYSIKRSEKKSGIRMLKLTSTDAQKIDRDFSAKFIKSLYELPASPSGCSITLRLTMRGEEQNVCGKEDKKTQEFSPFIKGLEQRF